VRLGRLGPYQFLEMRGDGNSNESQSIPGHSFWRIRLEGDSLTVLPLKPEYFEALIKTRKLDFALVVSEKLVVELFTHNPEAGVRRL